MSQLRLSTILVSGPDARDFLQAQLTNDLNRLESEPEILAAWCNPKGRVIWFGTARKTDDGYALSALAETAEAIVRRLTMFRFRLKVEFEIVDEGATADPASLVEQGFPWIGAGQSEQFTPHMLNLDLLDAVSFDKGCYPGQEIVARTHYRGATKRRMTRFDVEGPVSAGDKVADGERDVGEVVNAHQNACLAVVPIARADEALFVNGAALTHQRLPFLPD
ncbi:MAG: hypothetical protein QNJ07_17255 [Woeseiaceae bacterium]|nr:hypothetical protein [Woeseiaceae bacterium]